MQIIVYDCLKTFMEETIEYLKKFELQNNLIIGNCNRVIEKNLDSSSFFLASIKDELNEIKVIAMQTPPFPILVFEVDNNACDEGLACLIDYIINNELDIPGIVSEKELSKRFIDIYTKRREMSPKMGMNMRIYRLDEVKHRGEVEGKLRLATYEDLFYIPYWNDAFTIECEIRIRSTDFFSKLDKIKKQIDNNDLYIYEDKIPVSIIAVGRKTQNGVFINNVYTPPHYRKKGYATAMVSDLCTYLLNEGYKFCGLFTDLKNPISNSIYQKVGFYPICDFDEVWFN